MDNTDLNLAATLKDSLLDFLDSFASAYRLKEITTNLELDKITYLSELLGFRIYNKYGLKLCKVTANALGHSIADPLEYELRYQLGIYNCRGLVLYDQATVANRFLFESNWLGSIIFLEHSQAFALLNNSCHQGSYFLDLSGNCSTKRRNNYASWTSSSRIKSIHFPDFSFLFPEETYNIYREMAEVSGLTSKPFICLHIREPGYSSEIGEISDYNHRNCNMNAIIESYDFLHSLGYIIVKMGRSHMRSIKHPGVFDYATSIYARPDIDILLSQNCEFWLADGSGAVLYSLLTRKRLYSFNLTLPAFTYYKPGDISIFKRPLDSATGIPLSIPQLFLRGLDTADGASFFKSNKVSFIDNSSSEILSLTQIACQLNARCEDDRSKLEMCLFNHYTNRLFRSLVPADSYFSLTDSIVDPTFLAKHDYLLRFPL